MYSGTATYSTATKECYVLDSTGCDSKSVYVFSHRESEIENVVVTVVEEVTAITCGLNFVNGKSVVVTVNGKTVHIESDNSTIAN